MSSHTTDLVVYAKFSSSSIILVLQPFSNTARVTHVVRASGRVVAALVFAEFS